MHAAVSVLLSQCPATVTCRASAFTYSGHGEPKPQQTDTNMGEQGEFGVSWGYIKFLTQKKFAINEL